jgi:RNA-directed DNA polymerase
MTRIYPEHRLVKRRKMVNYRRRLHRLLAGCMAGRFPVTKLDASVQGWINHIRYGDTWGLRGAMLNFVIPQPATS